MADEGIHVPPTSDDLYTELRRNAECIPASLVRQFHPATHYLYEWKSYYFDLPEADFLLVNQKRVDPVVGSAFELLFKNQLGLVNIQTVSKEVNLCKCVTVEVLSGKFPSPQQHLDFFGDLLSDLFVKAIKLPYSISTDTSRTVGESFRPPTPFFLFHFLIEHAAALRDAINIILASPHQELADFSRRVRLEYATEADDEIMLQIMHHPETWAPASGFTLAHRLHGHAPAEVWQRLSEETYDTLPNQFVQEFLQQLFLGATNLPSQPWWSRVDEQRQETVRRIAFWIQTALGHPVFIDVGPMHRIPMASQVLLRKDGYRELFSLWQIFNQSRRPLFEQLHYAIEVRQIDQLYEIWAFFALIGEISATLDVKPDVRFSASLQGGLAYNGEANFGSMGRLVYNKTFAKRSYTYTMRPDYAWLRSGELDVVFDAKFRLTSLEMDESVQEGPETKATRDDIKTMHAYRDGLGIRAAVIVYPGDQTLFYDEKRGKQDALDLRGILLGERTGVGAMRLNPTKQLDEV